MSEGLEKVGKYIIERKIGHGGMGIVYKCLDPEENRAAAIKILPRQLAADAAFLQRFKREVMTLRRLDHPSIIRVFDQGEVEGSYYYAMEFLDGITLDALLEKGERLEPLKAIAIIRACAEGLEHSHARGVVHRDIKPANIMLLNDGGVKLMDFGIAKVLDATQMTATQALIGTVEYMSPEQSQGRHVDARTDIYSLGVVLYRSLTGRLPITGSTPTEIIMKLKTHRVESPRSWVPDLPRNLDELIMKMLEKEPEKRVESAKALLRELDRLERQIRSGDSGISERALTTGTQRRLPGWINPWMVGFIVLVVLLAVIALRNGDDENVTDEPGQAARYERRNYVLLLNWARAARDRKQLDYAEDLLRIIIKHFPKTDQAKAAEEELAAIQAERAAEEAADKTAPAPERDAP